MAYGPAKEPSALSLGPLLRIYRRKWSLKKKKDLFIYDRHREREAETQEEGEAGSMPGTRRGTRSRDSRIAPWAKGRRQTAEPPRDPESGLVIGNADRLLLLGGLCLTVNC